MSEDRIIHPNVVRQYDNPIFVSSGEKLYRDRKTADVYFVVRSGDVACKRIPAHKILLAAASDVFGAMFYGPLKEGGDVRIDNITVAVFEEFLQFFYIGKVKLTAGNVAGVMHLGHKYNVSECFKRCVQFIKDTLGDDNVCNGLGLAVLYDSNELKERCEKYISMNSDGVFKSANFLECDEHVLRQILDLDAFSCSEKVVFESCMSWVKFASKQNELTKEIIQAYLGDAFYEIRFRSMTVEEFVTLDDEYDSLFTVNECKEIIRMIALADYQPKLFTKMQRSIYSEAEDLDDSDLRAEEIDLIIEELYNSKISVV